MAETQCTFAKGQAGIPIRNTDDVLGQSIYSARLYCSFKKSPNRIQRRRSPILPLSPRFFLREDETLNQIFSPGHVDTMIRHIHTLTFYARVYCRNVESSVMRLSTRMESIYTSALDPIRTVNQGDIWTGSLRVMRNASSV